MKKSNAVFVHMQEELSIVAAGTRNDLFAFTTFTVSPSRMRRGHVSDKATPMNAGEQAIRYVANIPRNVQYAYLTRFDVLKRHILSRALTIQRASIIVVSDNSVNSNSFGKSGTEEAARTLKRAFPVNVMNVFNQFFWNLKTGWTVGTETEIRYGQCFITIIDTLS